MKIFVIDDEPVSIFLTRGMLELEGFAKGVETFMSAPEALQALIERKQENRPEVILLDLNMPEMDGWQFLDTLRTYEPGFMGACKVYILTSSLEYADLMRVQHYPDVAGYFHKPIKKEDIKKIGRRGDESVGANYI